MTASKTYKYYPLPGEGVLKSGDILFPKEPQKRVLASTTIEMQEMAANPERAEKITRYNAMSMKKLAASTDPRDVPLQQYARILDYRMHHALGAEQWDAWSGLPVPLVMSLCRLLFNELSDQLAPYVKDINLTFGHVAMVFEEDGQWFVAEAGCTDYSHYRVCIAPYWDAEDEARPDGQKRGWAARRAALGQCTWVARCSGVKPRHMDSILAECKNWLSVPYGILEPGMMDNPDRLYCSELLARALAAAVAADTAVGIDTKALVINQNQNWTWVIKRLLSAASPVAAMIPGFVALAGKSFPLLSPAMIYDSTNMHSVFKPRDAAGHELDYL